MNASTNLILARKVAGLSCALIAALGLAANANAAATINIVNNDAAGVGFNDTTAVAPVGGNTGTTLGAQRLIAFQAAAAKWGATLDSSIQINVRAQWTALTCTTTSAVLGSAGAVTVHRDFVGAPFTSTWYSASLANKLNGADLDATNPEINANFNINLGNAGCLDGTPFYLGLDNNHGTAINLVTVLTHEFGHGLGFQTFTNGTSGDQFNGFPSIYDRFLMDNGNGKSWLQMSSAERAASALNPRKLVWNGPKVLTDAANVLALGSPLLAVTAPGAIAGNYEVGAAAFGPVLTTTGITAQVVQALDPSDAAGTLTTDGCSALTNAAAVAGKIAMIDRGTCGFTVKVKNAQDAGAVAVIIADNTAGGPPAGLGGADATITIPAVRITLDDANLLKAQLGAGVTATLKVDNSIRAGADVFGKPMMFSPNPFQSGSSVSHWDTSATPNQLMEPAINTDLTHEVTPPNDLTYSQMTDIGWVASTLPSAISRTAGDVQNTAQNTAFATSPTVATAPGAAGRTVTWTALSSAGGASATFPSTGTRFAVSLTDASGQAVAPALFANSQAGTYALNATVPGAGTTVFSLTNAPASVAGPACVTDTSQADFLAGAFNNTDAVAVPGDVQLANPANLDQQSTTLGTSGVGITVATWGGQTFTPAISGDLKAVDINLFCSGCTGTTPALTVSVRATSGGVPTGADLATASIAGFNSGSSAYYNAVFATPLALTAGTMYAIVIRPSANPSPGTYALTRSGTSTLGADVYAGGTRVAGATSGTVWSNPLTGGVNTDAGFRTYMQTGYAAAGDFTSSLKDANAPAGTGTQWSSLSWNGVTPVNTTLRFQVAASNNFAGPYNFVGPDGTAGTFFASGASLSQFNGFRYLKTRAFLTTGSGTVTPAINDVTVCYDNVTLPDLTISKTHSGNFTAGQTNAAYTVTVSNTGATAKPASSLVTVTDTAPVGMTIVGMAGSGWSCSSLPACTRSDALAGGASYPPITVTVAVAAGASSPLVNSVAVTTATTEASTANNSANDPTTIVIGPTSALTVARLGSGGGSVGSLDTGINCGATCTQQYANGSVVQLTATANGDSTFTGWLGACTGSASTCAVTVNAATAVSATFALSPVASRVLDVDDNNAYEAAFDGVLILRHLLGVSGAALSNNATGPGANPARVADPALNNYLLDVAPYLDVDGDGRVDALTDGLMIVRKLLGLTGTAITNGAMSPNATRAAGLVEAYIQSLRP